MTGPGRDPGTRLRVLQLIKCLGYGGAERLLVDVAAHRDRDGFDYEVAYVLQAENGLVPAMEATGVPVHCLGARRDADLSWLARLRRLLAAGRFDVVHLHLPYAAGLGRLVALTMPGDRRPVTVTTSHSTWWITPLPARSLNRLTIARDRAILTVSEEARQSLPAALARRAEVVVHGIDLSEPQALAGRREEVRREVRAELGVPDGAVLALTVANLRREKGYDVLLAAAAAAAGRDLPVHFVSVGRGPLEEELREVHGRLGLGDRFRFLGPRGDVIRLMTGADLLVLPSHHEGMPVTLMEATAVGLPVVASAVGEVPQVVRDGVDGLLVPPGDVAALVEAVALLAQDEERRRRFGAAARDRASLFDVTRAVRRVEAIYREVAGYPAGAGGAPGPSA